MMCSCAVEYPTIAGPGPHIFMGPIDQDRGRKSDSDTSMEDVFSPLPCVSPQVAFTGSEIRRFFTFHFSMRSH